MPDPRVCMMADGLAGSEILRIAAEIRALQAGGREVCNLTVGDFSPRQFPVPGGLVEGVARALAAGETNYPPSEGLPELRRAISAFTERRLGLRYPVESVLVTAGARPGIYATFRALVDPGDRVVYPVPSWNNHYYVHLVGAVGVPVACDARTAFLPTRAHLEGAVRGARLLTLNSPLNPAGTAFTGSALAEICELVVEENARRGPGERPLYLLFDQVYWMLTFGGTRHVDPVSLVPAIAPHVVYVDGISKAFAATGMRVGWTLAPADVTRRMAALVGHMGAWAPRAEQVATAAFLEDDEAIDRFHDRMTGEVRSRLDALYEGLQRLRAAGMAVEVVPPMGAIYLSVRFAVHGRSTPSGEVLRTNADVRHYLLTAAGVGVVPFQAFGMPEDSGWFRLSVGAVATEEIRPTLARLEEALRGLGPGTAHAGEDAPRRVAAGDAR
jgi:aspartate aminotransferase